MMSAGYLIIEILPSGPTGPVCRGKWAAIEIIIAPLWVVTGAATVSNSPM